MSVDFRDVLFGEFPKLGDVLLQPLRVVLNLKKNKVGSESPKGGRNLIQAMGDSENIYVFLTTAHQELTNSFFDSAPQLSADTSRDCLHSLGPRAIILSMVYPLSAINS